MNRKNSSRHIGLQLGATALILIGMSSMVQAAIKLSNQTVQLQIGQRRPNVIYILADDMGIGDLGAYGQSQIETPNLDKMAAEGIRFTQHYSGDHVCGPTRGSLLTGQHTGHAWIRGNPGQSVTWNGPGDPPLRDEDVTIAEIFKSAGYATACIGKWGLGSVGTTGHPNRQGFDYFYGYQTHVDAHTYYPANLYRNTQQVPTNGVYTHDLFAEDVLNYIHEHKNTPFFIYLPYTIPHGPFVVPSDEPYSSKPWSQSEKNYAAMITRMDGDIGEMISLLKQLGIDEDTIVFFSSDNGAATGSATINLFSSTAGLRGRKRAMYEGGIRTPLIVRWPGKIAAGIVSDHVSAHWDMFPTFADLTGVKAPKGKWPDGTEQDTDGISLLPTLLGQEQLQEKHDHLYWEWSRSDGDFPQQAVLKDQWKLIRFLGSNPRSELYNLENDIGETNDVAGQNPTIVAQLHQIMDSEHVYSPQFPMPLIDP